MMRANLNHAIFSAIITFIVSFPLLGLNLVTGGTSMSIEGADTTTFTYIAAAVAIVFFFQLFRDKIMGVFSHIPTPEVGHLYSDLPQSKKEQRRKVVYHRFGCPCDHLAFLC